MAITFLSSPNEPFCTITQLEKGAEIAETTPDLLVNESHNWGVDVTENPVESGSPVADHKYVKPKEYSVTVEYSDAPISITEVGAKSDRITTAVEFFENLIDKAVTVNISTKAKDYESLICTGVQLGRNSGAGASQTFTASFKEFRTVFTESELIEPAPPLEPQLGGTKLAKTGKQTATPAVPSQASQASSPSGSILSRLTGVSL